MIIIDKDIDINYILELEVSCHYERHFENSFNSLSFQREEKKKRIFLLETEHELKERQRRL